MENQAKPNAEGNDSKVIKEVVKETPILHFPLKDSRKVVIKRRDSNNQVLPTQDKDEIRQKIGSSYKGSSVLRGLNPEEEKRFLPKIIGTNSSSQNWEEDARDYWLNISVEVPATTKLGGGLILEVGLIYETQEQYDADQKRKPNVNGVIENPAGEPINVGDYILYRYCLLYSECANDESLVGMSPKIRMFIFSEEKELVRKSKSINIVRTANQIYNSNIGDRNWVEFMLRNLLVGDQSSTVQIKDITALKDEQKDVMLYDYIAKDAEKFVKMGNDKDLEIRSFIELGVSIGALYRIPNTATVVHDGVTLGNTTDEVVMFLKNPKNAETFRAIQAQTNVLP